MTNATLSVAGDILTVTVDLSKTHGRSSSGKSEIIATSSGNVAIPSHPGVKLGLNVYR